MDISPRRAGFTIIEVLVVVSITAMLSGFLVLYNSSSRQQVALATERAKIGQVIARAKAAALTAQNQTPQTCGYGLFVDYSNQTYSYIRYEDPGGCLAIATVDPGFVQVIDSYVVNSSLSLARTLAEPIDYVIFVPPDPVTVIDSNGVVLGSGVGLIGINTKNGSVSSSVTVSVAGQINF